MILGYILGRADSRAAARRRRNREPIDLSFIPRGAGMALQYAVGFAIGAGATIGLLALLLS